MNLNVKKLNQIIVNNQVTKIAIPVSGSKKIVSQICITNLSRSDEIYVTIYAYGNNSNNIIFPKIKISPESHANVLEDSFTLPLISDDEILYAKTNSNGNALITVFGVEVV